MRLRRLHLGLLVVGALAGAGSLPAANLTPELAGAFDRYVRQTEARLEAQHRAADRFLWVSESPQRQREARQGGIAVEALSGKNGIDVGSGLIHDWVAAVFLPGTTLAETIRLVQDYDRHEQVYGPEVIESRILERNGDQFRIFMRLRKHKVITVILNTEHDVRYFAAGPTRRYSRSATTRIAEVREAGEPDERELPPGQGHGFLWRLNSYWRFEEKDGGVYVECEAISLTRDVPTGLGWLVKPIIRDLPKESLVNTLAATRRALKK